MAKFILRDVQCQLKWMVGWSLSLHVCEFNFTIHSVSVKVDGRVVSFLACLRYPPDPKNYWKKLFTSQRGLSIESIIFIL